MYKKVILIIVIIILITTGAFFLTKIAKKSDQSVVPANKTTEENAVNANQESNKVIIKEEVNGVIVEKEVVKVTVSTLTARGVVESISGNKIKIKGVAETKELNIAPTSLINTMVNGKYETKKASDVAVGSKVFAEYNTATMDITTMLLEQ